MKRKRWAEPQIVFALRQADEGTSVGKICRKMGVAEATFYRWRKRYGGLGVSEIRRLRQLGEENRRLTSLVADLSLDKAMLQDVLRKNMKPVRRRAVVQYVQTAWEVAERRACGALGFWRSTHRYRSVADRQEELRLKLRELAASRPSYGYRRLHILLAREGWRVNRKRVYRLYVDEGLAPAEFALDRGGSSASAPLRPRNRLDTS